MRKFFDGGGDQPPRRPQQPSVAALGDVDARLLWALRRLALMAPLGSARCQAVHVALQRDFGDSGLGIEHLLRCLLVGLARSAPRRLAFGTPACATVTDDEAVLLVLLDRPGDTGARDSLVRLAGAESARLLPLFRAVRALTEGQNFSDSCA